MVDDNALLTIKIIFLEIFIALKLSLKENFCSMKPNSYLAPGAVVKTTMAIGIYGPSRQDGVISSPI